MEYRMRESLRKSRIYILENVMFDTLRDHLIVQDIFSECMLDYITASPEHIEKVRRMLDYLAKRPSSCFHKFLEALVNSGQEHCADHIQRVYVQSGPTQVSEPMTEDPNPGLQEFPFSHPSVISSPSDDDPMERSEDTQIFGVSSQGIPFEMLSYQGADYGFPDTSSNTPMDTELSTPVQESMGIHPAGDSSRGMTMYDRHYQSNQNNVYRMATTPRGLALVINNEKFKDMAQRKGSQRDVEMLHTLFKVMGFHVCHQGDKTAGEMKALLRSFARYEALDRVDSLAVVILSHGGSDGVIYGKDGSHRNGQAQAFIKDEEIRDIFSARNCPLMAGKPKLFIIQACRGRGEDVADTPSPGPIPLSTPLPHPVPPPGRQQTDNAVWHSGMEDGSMASSASSTASSRTANMADTCLIHSTVHGYVSYRHPVDGSPFVKVLTEVFKEKAQQEHLMDMMAEVSQRLSTMPLQEDLRTIPSTTNTLTKKWFLNP